MSDNLPEAVWKEGIDKSDCYMILGTEEYFKSPVLFDQSHYALSKGKKFVIALKNGVALPSGFPVSKDSIIFTWDSAEELKEKSKVALRKLRAGKC
jgi:hypothetical protein